MQINSIKVSIIPCWDNHIATFAICYKDQETDISNHTTDSKTESNKNQAFFSMTDLIIFSIWNSTHMVLYLWLFLYI